MGKARNTSILASAIDSSGILAAAKGGTGTTTGGGGGGSGVTVYANEAALPAAGSSTSGQLAYVTATNKMYLFNGTVWFLIFNAVTPNDAPYISTGPAPGYLLSTSGTPTVITLTAQDPEGTPLNWSYSITQGALGNIATITQSNNVLTITPSTNSANSGQFEVTITASDGVNIANARTYIRLRFTTEDFGYGFILKSAFTTPSATNGQNAFFGRAISAYAGTLAVAGGKLTSGSIADSAIRSIYMYTTLAGDVPVLQAVIDQPAGATNFGTEKICLTKDMLVVPATSTVEGVAVATWYVYANISGSWTLTQTLYSSAVRLNAAYDPIDISSSGLVMAIANPSSANNAATYQGTEVKIYTRASTAITTWTLRDTFTDPDFSTVADTDHFPMHITISMSGKHIAFYSSEPDSTTAGVGKVIIFTNTTYAQGGTTWSQTLAYIPDTIALQDLKVVNTSKNDDIFYTFFANASVREIDCLTYVSGTNSWSNYPYNNTHTNLAFTNTGLAELKNNFFAYPGPDGASTVIFGQLRADPLTAAKSVLVVARAAQENLASQIPAGSNNGLQIRGTSWWNTPHEIPNEANQTYTAIRPQVVVDDLTGNVFVGARGLTYSGASASGAVFRYGPTALFAHMHGLESVHFGQTGLTQTTGTITVPAGVYYLSAVCVGCGGHGMGDATSTTGGGGGGGGALAWITNYPVLPGQTISWNAGGWVSAPTNAAIGGNNGYSQVAVNGTMIVFAGGGANGSTGESGGGSPQWISPLPAGTTTGGGSGGLGAGRQAAGTPGPSSSGSGGGAGGYNGAGGNYASSSGGAGGGGGATPPNNATFGNSGGGVGLYGPGAASVGVGANGSLDLGLPQQALGGGGGGSSYVGSGAGRQGGLGGVRILLGERFMIGPTIATTSLFTRPLGYTGG